MDGVVSSMGAVARFWLVWASEAERTQQGAISRCAGSCEVVVRVVAVMAQEFSRLFSIRLVTTEARKIHEGCYCEPMAQRRA